MSAGDKGLGRSAEDDGAVLGEGRARSSISSLKDFLGFGRQKQRSGSNDSKASVRRVNEGHEGMTDSTAGGKSGASEDGRQAFSPLDEFAEGQFDDANSIASPHRDRTSPSHRIKQERMPSSPLDNDQHAGPVNVSSRHSSSRTRAHAKFTFPAYHTPSDSPFYDPPGGLPSVASTEAQRRNLAVARPAGFIPGALADVRNEPFARSAREFDGMVTGLVMPTQITGAHHVPGGAPAPDLMQRIVIAIDNDNRQRPALAESVRSSSQNRVVSHSSDFSVSETVRNDTSAPSGIFSPNIPREPIPRHIADTLSRGQAKKLAQQGNGSRNEQSRAKTGLETLIALGSGNKEAAKPSAAGLVSAAEDTAGSAIVAERHVKGPNHAEAMSDLHRAASAYVSGTKADVCVPSMPVARPLGPLALSYKLSRTRHPGGHFNMTPLVPGPVPPSLLARSRSDGGRSRETTSTGETSSAGISGKNGQSRSAPGSTFVRHGTGQNAPDQAPLSPEEIDALIKAEVRARTKVTITPGTEAFVSGSASSSAAVSRASSRSSRSGGRGDGDSK